MSYFSSATHPTLSPLLFTVFGIILGGLLTIFTPETRGFVFSMPLRWRRMTVKSILRKKRLLEGLHGDAYELVLFIAISSWQAVLFGLLTGGTSLILTLFIWHLPIKNALLFGGTLGFAALEARVMRLITTLTDLWRYSKVMPSLDDYLRKQGALPDEAKN